jgi:hypothetical protein
MYTAKFNAFKAILDVLEPEVEKANKGNKSAKRRLRRGFLELGKEGKELRAILLQPTTTTEQE